MSPAITITTNVKAFATISVTTYYTEQILHLYIDEH